MSTPLNDLLDESKFHGRSLSDYPWAWSKNETKPIFSRKSESQGLSRDGRCIISPSLKPLYEECKNKEDCLQDILNKISTLHNGSTNLGETDQEVDPNTIPTVTDGIGVYDFEVIATFTGNFQNRMLQRLKIDTHRLKMLFCEVQLFKITWDQYMKQKSKYFHIYGDVSPVHIIEKFRYDKVCAPVITKRVGRLTKVNYPYNRNRIATTDAEGAPFLPHDDIFPLEPEFLERCRHLQSDVTQDMLYTYKKSFLNNNWIQLKPTICSEDPNGGYGDVDGINGPYFQVLFKYTTNVPGEYSELEVDQLNNLNKFEDRLIERQSYDRQKVFAAHKKLLNGEISGKTFQDTVDDYVALYGLDSSLPKNTLTIVQEMELLRSDDKVRENGRSVTDEDITPSTLYSDSEAETHHETEQTPPYERNEASYPFVRNAIVPKWYVQTGQNVPRPTTHYPTKLKSRVNDLPLDVGQDLLFDHSKNRLKLRYLRHKNTEKGKNNMGDFENETDDDLFMPMIGEYSMTDRFYKLLDIPSFEDRMLIREEFDTKKMEKFELLLRGKNISQEMYDLQLAMFTTMYDKPYLSQIPNDVVRNRGRRSTTNTETEVGGRRRSQRVAPRENEEDDEGEDKYSYVSKRPANVVTTTTTSANRSVGLSKIEAIESQDFLSLLDGVVIKNDHSISNLVPTNLTLSDSNDSEYFEDLPDPDDPYNPQFFSLLYGQTDNALLCTIDPLIHDLVLPTLFSPPSAPTPRHFTRLHQSREVSTISRRRKRSPVKSRKVSTVVKFGYGGVSLIVDSDSESENEEGNEETSIKKRI